MDRLILVTNDDGIDAGGIKALATAAALFGRVYVVAPQEPQSGMSHAITVKTPLRKTDHGTQDNITWISCSGTPVDCVKLAMNKVLPRRPDIILSGINHGANSATSVVYSGTMAAAIEGAINQIPSIGFSLCDYSHIADFTVAAKVIPIILDYYFSHPLPAEICLNVNIPKAKWEEIKGVKICKQTNGFWKEEFDTRIDPMGKEYYWLTGEFENLEPNDSLSDEFALKQNFVSIVPIKYDFTAFEYLDTFKDIRLK